MKQEVKDTFRSMKRSYSRALDVVQDKDKQQQTLTSAYIGAFSVIAILTLIGHSLTSHINNVQKENAEITYTITQMRGLGDSIVSWASKFHASKDLEDDNATSGRLGELRRKLAAINTRKGETIYEIFHQQPYVLSDTITTFLNSGEEFLRVQRVARRSQTDEAYDNFAEHPAKFMSVSLDQALDRYHADVISDIEKSFAIQYFSVLTILLVLLFEALFIFRPLVHRLGEYHKDLIRLALTDALTELNNRRAFMQLAAAGLDHYNRHKKPFALVLTDLDKFKLVNDTYGHKVGDLVLQHYSRIMLKFLRRHDILGRIGGEEFAIFLPQTNAQEALQIIERLRKTIMETPCPYVDKDDQSQNLSYTSSFGLVSVSKGAWTLDNLLVKADENLYQAKERGRNCVVMREL